MNFMNYARPCYTLSMPSAMGQGVIGHGIVVKLLERWAQAPSFSYVFTGPAHVGKRFLAERFVRVLAGCSPEQDLAVHPDVVAFELEEGKKEISVKSVRENRSRLYQSPQIASRLVAFIPRMDRLNEEGFNALLKVMEEPPANAVFVSVAANVARIPATILSRSVQIPLGLVPQNEIVEALLQNGMPKAEAEKRALAARGRPGLALTQDDSLSVFRPLAESWVAAQSVGQRLNAIDKLRQVCESQEDAAAAWHDALQACSEAVRASFVAMPVKAVILGQGIADALAAIGGSVGPRLMLEASAVQVARQRLPQPSLYPKIFPHSLCI